MGIVLVDTVQPLLCLLSNIQQAILGESPGVGPPVWLAAAGHLSHAGIDFSELVALWDGNYSTNDGQVVMIGDAYSLPAALERSLDDIPDTRIETDWDFSSFLEDDLPHWLSPAERELVEEELQEGLLDILGPHPCEFFAGEEKYHLVQFIKFCRLGSFEIL